LITVAISTLGCKVNQYESAGILERLDKTLFLPVPFHTKADCYIINTCTVTGRTDYQSRQIIRRAIRMNPDACIIVTGCYAQVAPGDIARIPGVSLIAGTAEKENIPQIIEHLVKGDPQLLVTDICQANEFSRLSPSQFPGHTRAFLKIQDGCNSFCSYCIKVI
jgi:threonylcarbamoyladenosine tRNA methylthiotransferase MtaB